MRFAPLDSQRAAVELAGRITRDSAFPAQVVMVSNETVDGFAVAVDLARNQTVVVTEYADFLASLNRRVSRALAFLRDSNGMGDVPSVRPGGGAGDRRRVG